MNAKLQEEVGYIKQKLAFNCDAPKRESIALSVISWELIRISSEEVKEDEVYRNYLYLHPDSIWIDSFKIRACFSTSRILSLFKSDLTNNNGSSVFVPHLQRAK